MTATVARTIPADPAECAQLLAEAADDRRTVRITGSGTKSYLGDVSATDVELSTERLAGVIDHVPADLTVTLGAGTRMADVAAALARAGQFLPIDPPHADSATVGGVIAASSNGFWRARYGGVRDLLIGTRTALADGTVARAGGLVVKNVAGYDLNKLLVGSLGTLGVIVEATLKVLPLPEKSDGLVARFERPVDAFAAAHAIVRGASRVEACVVERSAQGSWILAVQARGGGPTVDRAIRDARGEVAARHGDTAELGDDLGRMRELPARAIDGVLVRVALPLAASGAFAESAVGLESSGTVVVDVASGIARVHLVNDDDAVIRDAEALLLAARMVGGAGRIERRAEDLRSRLLTWPNRPNGDFLMRRIKEAFDPAGILEPGRSAFV
ncbi:MAG TPA: FAD-binding oxidoreductase [Candidatus Bathyarchaeia archaeon]|nr:FAD-binding oxidoreductase [Candidatus Bathyarchaeia archaeon]